MQYFTILALIAIVSGSVSAQMAVDQDTLYGNEWIQYHKTHAKLKVPITGIYRVTFEELQQAGLDLIGTPGEQVQMYHLGKEIRCIVSTSNSISLEDYILFWGVHNGSELDQYLFLNGYSDMLHPGYSLVNDTAAYFVVQGESPGLRYQPTEFINGTALTPELYYYKEAIDRQSSNFVKRPNGVGSMSRFSDGEGFSSGGLVTRQVDLPASSVFSSAPAKLHIRMATNNTRDHELVYSFNGAEIARKQFSNFAFLKDTFLIDGTNLQATNRFSFERQGAAENRYFHALTVLQYPRSFVWPSGQNWEKVPIPGVGSKRIIWESYPYTTFLGIHLTSGQWISISQATATVDIAWNQSGDGEWIFFAPDNWLKPANITTVNFQRLESVTGTYLMIYHPDISTTTNGTPILDQYIQYRNETGHSVIPVNVIDIYDQFGYGIDRHFIALRNFMHYIKKLQPGINHAFLIGKGREFRNLRTPEQIAAAKGSFFIPTFGAPGADQLFVCHNHQVAPLMAIGRIPVSKGEELELYLQKVKAYERTQSFPVNEANRKWMKNVLHLSGGNAAAEREQLRQIMVRSGNVLTNGPLQPNIIPFAKLSSEPIEDNVPALIYDIINEGTSLITFLGHSGSTTIDFNIENFNRYTNKDRYFPFLALGCSVGNIHIPGVSLGERFVFQQDKGAIAFLASSGLGYPSILENYASRIYEFMGTNINQSMGSVLKDVHLNFRNTGNRFFLEQLEQMTINGDPALKYNYPEGPDFTFLPTATKILEGNTNISQDSFTLSFDLLNLGSLYTDSIPLSIVRVYPDNTSDTLLIKIKAASFRSTKLIRLPIGGERSAGQNTIYMTINPDRSIEEAPSSEAYYNNQLTGDGFLEGYRFFVFGVSATPAWPPTFAVIPDNRPVLKAFTGNLNAPIATYIMELDTIPGFNSPFKKQMTVTAVGGVLTWTLSEDLLDTTTYFWRISGDSLSSEDGFNWATSSFSVSTSDPYGLSLRHPDQFKGIESATLKLDSSLGWVFGQVSRNLEIKNQLFLNNNNPSGSIDGFVYSGMFPWNVLHQGILVQVIDPTTGIHWRNPPGGIYGSINTLPLSTLESFPFDTRNFEQRRNLINFLKDTIPDNFIVFVYSIQRTAASSYAPEEWESDSLQLNGLNIFNVLENQGIQGIRSLKATGSLPFISGYIKGKIPLEEIYADNVNGVVDIIYPYLERILSGSVKWIVPNLLQTLDQSKWMIQNGNAPATDSTAIVFSYNTYSDPNTIITPTNNQLNGQFEWDEIIDPTDMQYTAVFRNSERLAPQLQDLTVSGHLLPDLIIYKQQGATWKDTVPQGQILQLPLVIENLSDFASDSFDLKYQLVIDNRPVYEDRQNQLGLEAKNSRSIILEIPTSSQSGRGDVVVEINTTASLRELRVDNNFLTQTIWIEGDRSNPLLDVYFDGLQIMDGDLVSAQPEIQIFLRDDNPYFLLQDTSILQIRLRRPSGSWQTLSFQDPDIRFIPASENDRINQAVVWLHKPLMEDGEYTLEIIGRDAAGNFSGSQPLQKRFKVINQQMISGVVNYPNPFSSSTQFVYTLTGSDSPDYFKIQIFSLSGQLVREISHIEIGPLRVGTHATEYRWDGTDQYGQRLANGVYLYRMVTRNLEEKPAVEHFESKLDQYITNGWSKMVLLR